jgi:ribonuclease HI
VIRTMARSVNINIRSVRFVCDNEAAVKRCNQNQTKSVFHNTEGDWDLVSTYRDLKEQWCDNIDVSVRWVKGHADQEGRPLTKYERLNVEARIYWKTIFERKLEGYTVQGQIAHIGQNKRRHCSYDGQR